ncbi:3-dehydroquinate synthase [Flavobacterium sp.]|uniref:3-dehydroquinate synthase n=1 Tax=Flavobacterium sp. TaxID=239 RepID=UPI0035B30B01
MKSIEANGYEVFFNEEGYKSLNLFISQKNYSNIFIILDTNSNENCLQKFISLLETEKNIEIIEIEPGEAEKNINTCVEIWSILTELGADRKSLVINIGGGVITDIGGFIASTFKRGIDFINVPTTLLAMVDASIGGKNGVDLGNLKNQIGVINVPKMVVIDTDFLSTLPQNEMRSGLAEMLKHGLIFDKNYWNEFKNLSEKDFADFDRLIHRSVEIKNEIVKQDPTENGIRKALNFGHTLGHAIESYFLENENKKTLLHGEAIAVGMILESFISNKLNLITKEELAEIKYIISDLFEKINIEANDVKPIMELLIHDKKNEYGKIQFALLKNIGNFSVNQTVENSLIEEAFNDYLL